MKKNKLLLLPLVLLSLVGCDLKINFGSNANGKPTDKQDVANKPELITVFSINDLHGSLKENPDEGELGLAKLEYAIKNDVDYNPETSIIISCGDSWQGGYLSYKERTITDELLGEMGVEAMVLGNHEFDWGIDNIKILREQSPFPFLACNIKDPNGRHTDELSDNHTIIEKAGAKIGIIGAMGAGEESSIAASSLAGYSFDSRTSIIKDEVNYLTGENCDLILLAAHDSYKNENGYVNSIASTLDTNQIQGIFGAHTHYFESGEAGSNKIPFVQGGCNSRGYAKMSFSLPTKKAVEHSYVKAFSSYYNIDASLLNQTIVSRIEESDKRYNGSEEICQLQGDFRRGYELNKFVPEIMLKQAINYGFKGKNELIALHNNAGIRANLSSGSLTREKLFKVEPFENKVKIIKNISGSKVGGLLGTINGSYSSKFYAYMRETDQAFDSSKTYDVVTIDYVSEGYYGKRCFGDAPQYDLRDEKPFILDIMIDYLQSSENKVFNAADYR